MPLAISAILFGSNQFHRGSCSLEKAIHLLGAAKDPAFTVAAAVFDAETLAGRGGGAPWLGTPVTNLCKDYSLQYCTFLCLAITMSAT